MKFMKDESAFFLDTNILIYAWEKDESLRKEISKKILEKCYKNEITLAVSNQNLAEFSCVALKKIKIDPEIVRKVIHIISGFNGFLKLNYKRKTILSAINISEKYHMSFWDSLIAATMIENQIFKIYTENSKDFKVPSINVINPFQ